MKDFDRIQQEQLRCLTTRRVYVHFPFFANTFSLPYHYVNALAAELEDWGQARKLIVEHDWEYPIPSLVRDQTNVFYATSAAVRGFLASRESAPWSITSVAFTRYRPLWIFMDYRPFIAEAVRGESVLNMFSKELVSLVRNERIHRIDLLTDIPDQASVVVRHLKAWGFEEPIFMYRDPGDTLREFVPAEKAVRLYFYGAPSTTRMLADRFTFLPFGIPETVEWDDETTITNVCIAVPRNKSSLLSDDDVAALRVYHDRIFKAALDSHADLVNVWWAYNRYAERKQHSATFKNPEIFAKCLREHHRDV